jgi:U3 small nucleolar RNA-associated protein 22
MSARPCTHPQNQAFDVVFVDPSGFLNVLAHMTVGAYLDLRHEAGLATRLLDDQTVDGFVPLFMTPINFHTKFDLTVVCDNVGPAIARRYPSQLLDRAADWEAFALSFTAAISRRALGDRATLVTCKPRLAPRWDVGLACPSAAAAWPLGSATAATTVTMGILLDGATATRRLEKGPPADHAKEVAAFRDFWGTKAELRRFPDGSVMEAVLWDVPLEIGRYIPQEILHHALRRHAG